MKKLVLAIGLVCNLFNTTAQNPVNFDIEIYDLVKIKQYNIEDCHESNNFITEFLINEFDNLKNKKLTQSDIDLLFKRIKLTSYNDSNLVVQISNNSFYYNDTTIYNSEIPDDFTKDYVFNSLLNKTIQSIEYSVDLQRTPDMSGFKSYENLIRIDLVTDSTKLTYMINVAKNNVTLISKYEYHIIAVNKNH
jgi:hypothetical protein